MRPLLGGLGPACLQRIKELLHAKIEDESTLIEIAQSVEDCGRDQPVAQYSLGAAGHVKVPHHETERPLVHLVQLVRSTSSEEWKNDMRCRTSVSLSPMKLYLVRGKPH